MTPTPVTGFRLPLLLLERIDAARGEESRTSWLVRSAEEQLDDRSPKVVGGVPPVDVLAVEERAMRKEMIDEAGRELYHGPTSSSAAKAGVVPR